MGSLVALSLTEKYPELVKRLILLGTAKRMIVNDYLLETSKSNVNKAIEMIVKWSFPYNVKLRGGGAPSFWLPAIARKTLQNNEKLTLYRDLSACNNFILEKGSLNKIKIPVTIIAGQKDIMTPAREAKKLTENLIFSKLHILAKCGHMMMLEESEKVNEILKNLIIKDM